jgi:hypothetical protein
VIYHLARFAAMLPPAVLVVVGLALAAEFRREGAPGFVRAIPLALACLGFAALAYVHLVGQLAR